VSHVVESALASLEEFQGRDNGWILSRILNLTVNTNKHNPLRARCHIKLPREIMLKRAVITCNPRKMHVAALYPAQKHVERESSYSHYTSILNFASIEFSMTLSQIRKFETLNISINVYINEKGFVPILLADRKKSKHVNLFGGWQRRTLCAD